MPTLRLKINNNIYFTTRLLQNRDPYSAWKTTQILSNSRLIRGGCLSHYGYNSIHTESQKTFENAVLQTPKRRAHTAQYQEEVDKLLKNLPWKTQERITASIPLELRQGKVFLFMIHLEAHFLCSYPLTRYTNGKIHQPGNPGCPTVSAIGDSFCLCWFQLTIQCHWSGQLFARHPWILKETELHW